MEKVKMKLKNLGRTGKVILGLILLIFLSPVIYSLYIFIVLLNFPNKLPPINLNELAIERSKYIGKEFIVGPLFRLVKLEHYDGSKLDNYFYIFRFNSDEETMYDLKVEKIINIEKPISFKVVGVDFRDSTVHSYYYCLLESSEFPGHIAQEECEKLENINMLFK